MAHGNGEIKLGWHGKGFAFFLCRDRDESTCTLHTAKLPTTSTVCENVPIMHRSIYTFMLLQLIMEVSKGQGGNLCGNDSMREQKQEKRGERQREDPGHDLIAFLLIINCHYLSSFQSVLACALRML